MGKKKRVNVGVIGSGAIAELAHIPNYKKLDGVEVVALSDINLSRAEKMAQEFDVPRAYGDYRKMLKENDLDIVSVCTPNYAHCQPTIDTLRAGVNVICEKPIAMNGAEGKRMVEAAKRYKRLLTIALHFRFTAQAQTAKRYIESGKAGDIYFGKAVYLRRRGIPWWGQFHLKEKSGGGPLIDIGVHIMDLVMWLMGHPKPVSVTGKVYQKFGKKSATVYPNQAPTAKQRREFDVEDFATGLVKFENGASMVVETSWAANVEKDAIDLSVLGDKAGISVGPPGAADGGLRIYTEMDGVNVDVTPAMPEKNSAYFGEIEYFVRCVRGEAKVLVKPEEALSVQKVIDAIYKSSETGREIAIR